MLRDISIEKGRGISMIQTKLKISGMHCEHCSASVEKALKGVKGVSSAKVDLVSNQASVEYDPTKTNLKNMVEAVRKAGFDAG
jgi:copper chaperone CopZ